MSKADQQSVKSSAQKQIGQNQQFQQQTGEQLQNILGGYQSQASSLLPSVVGGYSDIATTGGLSPTDISSIQSRAAESARAAYDVGSGQAKRETAATGGYGPSGAITGNLARKGSQAASQATVDTNASLAGLISGNKLAALGGLGNLYGLTENEVNHTINSILQNYQLTGQLNNQDLSILTNLAEQPGVFDKIVGTIGTLGGAAAGVLGALNPAGAIGNTFARTVTPRIG